MGHPVFSTVGQHRCPADLQPASGHTGFLPPPPACCHGDYWRRDYSNCRHAAALHEAVFFTFFCATAAIAIDFAMSVGTIPLGFYPARLPGWPPPRSSPDRTYCCHLGGRRQFDYWSWWIVVSDHGTAVAHSGPRGGAAEATTRHAKED